MLRTFVKCSDMEREVLECFGERFCRLIDNGCFVSEYGNYRVLRVSVCPIILAGNFKIHGRVAAERPTYHKTVNFVVNNALNMLFHKVNNRQIGNGRAFPCVVELNFCKRLYAVFSARFPDILCIFAGAYKRNGVVDN